ncbi:DUF7224 domain-containing protein [Streptomyces gelaticus]|nr:hypothetical protein [Streptomyces gelaticus]
MLVLPVSLALGSAAALPTPASLGPLLMAMGLCVAHAVIGFAIGLFVPRAVAAPIMAALVWVLVAFSWSTDAFWVRHVSGQYPTSLMFGELASYGSFAPHLLFTGGIAAGVAALWLPLRPKAIRAALAAATAVLCPVLAVQSVQDWGPNPPLLAGQAAMSCAGKAPRVCIPQASSADPAAVAKEAASVLSNLHAAGFTENPQLVVDRMADGRYPLPSTETTWRVGLTNSIRQGDLRYQLTRAAVRFPCARVDPAQGNAAMLWAATVTGEQGTYNQHMTDRGAFPQEKAVRSKVRKVLASSPAEQGKWLSRTLAAGCGQGS